MTTATETLTEQAVDPNIGDRFTEAIDLGYTKETDHSREPRPGKPFILPGRYILRAGKFANLRFKRANSAFPASYSAELPLTVVSAESGDETLIGQSLNKYWRISTERVSFGQGREANYSTFTSACEAFGVPVPEEGTQEAIEAALTLMEGMESQYPIYVTLQGYAKAGSQWKDQRVKLAGNDRWFYLNEKAFRRDSTIGGGAEKYLLAGGTYARLGFLTDPADDLNRAWTLDPQSENTNVEKVFAQSEPARDGFRQK